MVTVCLLHRLCSSHSKVGQISHCSSVVGESVAVVAKAGIGVGVAVVSGVGHGVVGGESVGKGGLGLPLLPLRDSGDSGLLGGVGLSEGGLGLSNPSSVHGSNGELGVEGGGNTVVDGGHGETRVSHTESSGIGDILDLLKNSVGVHVGVTTGHTAVGVASLGLGRVQVGVAVVQVAELILGVELAAHVGGDGGGVGDRGHWGSNRGSGIGYSRGSSIGEAGIAVASVGVAGVVVEG